jgi:2-polyprenyl-3-methyl-5-hydroxy-6-metoxy-1,4-benzoquinol methylase
MDEEILVSLREIVSRHPWWSARAHLVVALLGRLGILPPANILEAGCGWGTNLAVLEAAGYKVTGLDVSRRMLEKLDRWDRKLIEADLSKPLPAGSPTYDCVLALDVIEHIDDDRQAVRQLGRLVKPGGRLLLSVPALPELFSEFDEIQGTDVAILLCRSGKVSKGAVSSPRISCGGDSGWLRHYVHAKRRAEGDPVTPRLRCTDVISIYRLGLSPGR